MICLTLSGETVNIHQYPTSRWFLFVVCMLLLFACEEAQRDIEPSYTYPLALGNYWVYSRTQTNYSYSESTGQAVFEDSSMVCESISVTVSYHGTWDDSLERFVLNSFCCHEDCRDHTSWHHYTQNDTALLLLGYKSPVNQILPKPAQKAQLSWMGATYSSMAGLLSQVAPSPLWRTPAMDSVHIEDPMIQVLKYPLVPGAQWTYRDSGNPWKIDREVIFQKQLSVSAGSFSVYEIQMTFDMDNDGDWDQNIHITDHFAQQGLIRREIFIDSVVVVSPDGTLPDQLIRYLDVYELNRFRVN